LIFHLSLDGDNISRAMWLKSDKLLLNVNPLFHRSSLMTKHLRAVLGASMKMARRLRKGSDQRRK